MSTDIQLRANDAEFTVVADIAVAAGGRVRQVTIERDGHKAELLIDAASDSPAWSKEWGLYPMAPWAGRLRNGRFTCNDRSVALNLNHVDSDGAGGGTVRPPEPAMVDGIDAANPRRHAIHGVVFALPWTVERRDENSITTTCSLVNDAAHTLGWPFDGLATQVITVRPDGIDLELSVTASDGEAFPATVGWHPWFAKPDRLEISPSAMYEVSEPGLPTGRMVDPLVGPWDDCFLHTEPARLIYERAVAPVITVTTDCDHLVVFDMLEHATCVEPQSGPPDAPNVRPVILRPGAPLRRTMSIDW